MNNNKALTQYENNHPNIVIDKTKTVCKNEFEWGEQYILLITDTDDKMNPEIVQVMYQGNRKEMGRFRLDRENPDCLLRNEGEISFGFRTVTKPRVFYNVLLSDIDVDCYIYAFGPLKPPSLYTESQE